MRVLISCEEIFLHHLSLAFYNVEGSKHMALSRYTLLSLFACRSLFTELLTNQLSNFSWVFLCPVSEQ